MSATATAVPTTALPTGTWAVDPSHTRVEFRVKHLGISTVRGHFSEFEGVLELGDESKARGSVSVASVDTNEPKRDDHLRSADFFDAEQFPKIEFESTSIEDTGDGTFEITGDLTLHGVTRELVLDAEITGAGEDPWGGERVGLEVTGQLDRSDYGMTFNQALGGGNVLVSDKVKLALEIEAVRQ
jgi:polyisoprenoid-binding protein YceI